MSSEEDKYIETNVHPILEKLGESLAAVMPDDIDQFVVEWLEEGGKCPKSRAAKSAAVDARKKYVQNQISPMLWQITYDCLTSRPVNVMDCLIERMRKKVSKADSDDDSSGDEVDEKEMERMQNMMNDRRIGVSAEKMTEEEMADWRPPFYEKTQAQRDELKGLIRRSKDGKMHMLFGLVSEATLEKVIDAVELKKIPTGVDVIKQGAQGDFFYIVKSGFFDIFVNLPDGSEKKVWEAGSGFAFGELALLYNAPRSATIRATQDSECWALDRTAFRMLVVMAQEEKMKEYNSFLQKVNIFETLSPSEVSKLAEVIQEEDFDEDEAIIEQGEVDNSMFIVMRGSCVACIQKDDEEIEVMKYGPGDYFGEIALLKGVARKASVYATSKNTVCLMCDEPSFRRILGPIRDILKRKITLYQAYDDFMDGDDAGAKSSTKKKASRRKREAPDAAKKHGKREGDEDKEPATLKDKVAADFQRPNLVKPTEKFRVKNSTFSLFADLKAGQVFTNDKPLNITPSPKVVKSTSEDVTSYAYSVPYPLKNPTHTSILIQKGQESAFDPTPNQDNIFYHSMDNGILITGVCDGHGPFGHIVSYRTVQTIPHYLCNSEHYAKDWEKAFTEAFDKAHKDLIEFSAVEDIPFDVSGTTATIMVRHEQKIHMGWCGDSNVMLASWNRHDSREIFTSWAHVPERDGEKQRIESCGSDVREVGEGSFRIYLSGKDIPGLTMSRALGDFMLGNGGHGVIQVPEYKVLSMQPGDEWYAIVASDGIWEFLTADEVVKFTSKKLRLKGPRETCKNLVESSRKRWKHVEGDYCDDISCMILMFNQKAEGETNNHKVDFTTTDPAA